MEKILTFAVRFKKYYGQANLSTQHKETPEQTWFQSPHGNSQWQTRAFGTPPSWPQEADGVVRKNL